MKRFTETTIWDQDWFLELPKEYKLFWFYIKDKCDHGGIFKPNCKQFSLLNECTINLSKSLEYFNKDKNRIEVLDNGNWLLTDYFVFQYGGTLNTSNRVHLSVNQLYIKNGVNMTSIRGLKEVKDGVKDKDINKDIDKPPKPIVVSNGRDSDEQILEWLNSEEYVMGFIRTLKMNKQLHREPEQIRKSSELFLNHLNQTDDVYKQLPKEYRKHFANWFNHKLKNV